MKLAPDYFDEIWNEYINDRRTLFMTETEAKYFFSQGRRSAQSEKSEQSKRTIEHVYHNDKAVFVLSNDKKVFALRMTDAGFQWVLQPDLPQD